MRDKSLHITVGGTVQGVGFRPFVYRTAVRLGIRGRVRNSPAGVVCDAAGSPETLERFVRALREEAPPLAAVRSVEVRESDAALRTDAFAIDASEYGERPEVDVTRDSATCAACVRELFDPDNRRFRHPFINCTECGPRYTIIRQLPYDRPGTTMQPFAMCPRCDAEYHDAADRRFHAQPVCCPDCGPRLWLADRDGNEVDTLDPIRDCVKHLAAGHIVAIKGLGGFHLACRADDADAVGRLRRRKQREQKPLAIMARDIATLGTYCEISGEQRRMLESIERPIVLLPKKPECDRGVAPQVAPTVTTLGAMLPCTPVHHLLLDTETYETLVMTSGNRRGEPICRTNEEALRTLRGTADAFLLNDREIHVRVDDSIGRLLGREPVLLRRARGYVPDPIAVDVDVDGIVALGGIMKSTICVGRSRTCYVSQYLGTADNLPTIDNCVAVLRHLLNVLGIHPRRYVRDLHPGGFVDAVVGDHPLPCTSVQHHHAHAAACLGENGLRGPAVCLIFDGLGMGDDGTIWGGEILIADRKSYRRVGHLRPVPMPGGDAATRYPGRMAMGALWGMPGNRARDACPWMESVERDAVSALLRAGMNCPRTSSMGRLFDAAAAILDVCRRQTYQGQPAIELEGIADRDHDDPCEWELTSEDGCIVMEGPRLLASVLQRRQEGIPSAMVSAGFHAGLADMSIEAAANAAREAGLSRVVLSGGCFQNALLFERIVHGLHRRGLEPVVHRILSPGDECISLGQALIAAEHRQL